MANQTTPTAVQLEPCPFCRGPAEMRYQRLVGCWSDDCPVNPNVSGDTPEQAAEAWNTRAAIPKAKLDTVNADSLEGVKATAEAIRVKAISGATNDRNTLSVHFNGPVTDQHRKLLADAPTIPALRAALENARDWCNGTKGEGQDARQRMVSVLSIVNAALTHGDT